MSVFYPLIQALVLFAVAPLLVRYYSRGARPSTQSPRAGRVAGVPRHYQTARSSEYCAR